MTKLEEGSVKKLHKFVSKLPLEHRIKPEYWHITICYDKAFDENQFQPNDDLKDAVVYPIMWDVFGDEQKVLVLRVQSPDLTKRHEELKELGVKHNFDEYKPHITIAVVDEKFDTSVLPIPTFDLIISHEYAKPLDPKYKYDPKSMCEGEIPTFSQQLVN